MAEQITIALLFAGALAYLGNLIFKPFRKKEGCDKGCGACPTGVEIKKTH